MCQPEGVYRADGAMGQFTIVVPDLDMLIAITENAREHTGHRQSWIPCGLFLKRIRKNPAAGENKTASDALKKRMSALSLPAPKYHPFSPYMEKVDGSSYQVEEGNFYLGCDGVEMIMGGTPLPPAVQSFTLHFTCDTLCISTDDGNETFDLWAAMDGSRRQNLIPGRLAGQVLASAWWEQENVLVIELRKIETCGKETLTFNFKEDQVTIEDEDTLAFKLEMPDNCCKKKIKAGALRTGKFPVLFKCGKLL